MKKEKHLHGSVEVWDELFEKLDLSYSETTETQGKLFELMKVGFLEEIFPKKGKILEVGSGTGFVSLYFSKRGYKTVLLDTSHEVLKVAEENFQKEKVKGKFIVGDAESLPFRDNEFDIVTSFGLLEHFEDPQNAISEMVRVLKPGGLFFADIVPKRFSVQSFGNIFNFKASFIYWALKKGIKYGYSKAIKNFKPLYYENELSVNEYKKIMDSAGLRDIEVRGNRPYPRLTLPKPLDLVYTKIMKLTLQLWKSFDRSRGNFNRTWGAGWWFWGIK